MASAYCSHRAGSRVPAIAVPVRSLKVRRQARQRYRCTPERSRPHRWTLWARQRGQAKPSWKRRSRAVGVATMARNLAPIRPRAGHYQCLKGTEPRVKGGSVSSTLGQPRGTVVCRACPSTRSFIRVWPPALSYPLRRRPSVPRLVVQRIREQHVYPTFRPGGSGVPERTAGIELDGRCGFAPHAANGRWCLDGHGWVDSVPGEWRACCSAQAASYTRWPHRSALVVRAPARAEHR